MHLLQSHLSFVYNIRYVKHVDRQEVQQQQKINTAGSSVFQKVQYFTHFINTIDSTSAITQPPAKYIGVRTVYQLYVAALELSLRLCYARDSMHNSIDHACPCANFMLCCVIHL
jgi:hypothetical protein